MHLHIQESRIGRIAALGILGTEETGNGKSRVQFLLSLYPSDLDSCDIIYQCELELGIKINDSYVHHFIGGGGRKTTVSFFLQIDGGLRNPRRFLKAVTHKISRAIDWASLGREAELAAETLDVEWKGNLLSTDSWQSDQMQADAEKDEDDRDPYMYP